MKIEHKHGQFWILEDEARSPDEVAILVNRCRHVIQDGPLAERDPETNELTPKALALLGHIVLEDHLEFCLGKIVDYEIPIDMLGDA